jgi:hypothetical protein
MKKYFEKVIPIFDGIFMVMQDLSRFSYKNTRTHIRESGI